MTDEHGTYRRSKLRWERDKTFLGRREAHGGSSRRFGRRENSRAGEGRARTDGARSGGFYGKGMKT